MVQYQGQKSRWREQKLNPKEKILGCQCASCYVLQKGLHTKVLPKSVVVMIIRGLEFDEHKVKSAARRHEEE